MRYSIVRFLLVVVLFLHVFIVLFWLDAHLTTLLENRLQQIMNTAVSGVL